jgi:2-polyprenyl-6-methoxyphenol hydroxylase-like FAD-dependent oxidoreductase
MESVVIAGGGPTGLMLACELRLAGVDVLVLERLSGPSGESRAGGIHARTMEVLDQRGMLEPFLAEGRPLGGGHFAGLPLDLSGLPTRYPYLLVILQRRIERLLEAHARDLGVRIRREVDVESIAPGDDRVLINGDIEAEWVVGCDGGRSTVRRLAGIDFPGTAATMTAILGDVELTDPPGPVFQRQAEGGNYSVLNFEPGWFRVITNEFGVVAGRDTPVTADDLRTALKRLAGTDFGLHAPRWVSRYNDAARLATRYRAGRVLLAGDAAHIHYPAGGQGLNTGVQDAVNLGWKLAAVVQGQAPEELLDSYHAERHPVGERVVRNTRAQTALTRPDPQTEALRSTMGGLLAFGDANRSLAMMITGLDIEYGPGHGRAPDLDLPDGTRLYQHLHAGRPILVGDIERPGIESVPAPVESMLVRPDGYVGWTASMDSDALPAASATAGTAGAARSAGSAGAAGSAGSAGEAVGSAAAGSAGLDDWFARCWRA